MAHLISENAIAYGINDATTIQGFESYKNKAFAKLHQNFYAVIMHGEPNGIYVNNLWSPQDFAPLLKKWHENYGKSRAILLISCWVGWDFAGLLATKIQLPVVAALSKVAFGMHSETGQMKCHIAAFDDAAIFNHERMTLKRNLKFYLPEWKIFYPSGRSETIKGGMYLNQDEAVRLVQGYNSNLNK